jgi:hypothetical protein
MPQDSKFISNPVKRQLGNGYVSCSFSLGRGNSLDRHLRRAGAAGRLHCVSPRLPQTHRL